MTLSAQLSRRQPRVFSWSPNRWFLNHAHRCYKAQGPRAESRRSLRLPKVIASVIGMESAINNADRHSQNPINDTITTRMMASLCTHSSVFYRTQIIPGPSDSLPRVFHEQTRVGFFYRLHALFFTFSEHNMKLICIESLCLSHYGAFWLPAEIYYL
jgi:hypothetical protein